MLSCFSRVWLFVTLWIIARQASLFVGFSRWEYWSGLPCSPPGELPDPGIKPVSVTSPVLSGMYFTTSVAWEAHVCISIYINLKYFLEYSCFLGFLGGSVVKKPSANAGDMGSVPGSGRSPGEGNDNPLEYSCLWNPVDRGAWRATVHRVAEGWMPLSD